MEAFSLIILGITGNLTQKYLIPALYDMEEKGLLPEEMKIIGVARKPMGETELEEYINKILRQDNLHHKHEINQDVAKKLYQRLQYLNGDLSDPKLYHTLKENIKHDNRIFYLATYPDLYPTIFNNLKTTQLNQQTGGWVRLMIEKPIGNNLESAKKVNELLLQYFSEEQIYRLDHYLGKETLQNILTFRFGNGIFEPLINSEYIDHIQVTAAENFGIGKRGGYYDTVGALIDVGQNHLLQMLTFATMDAPSEFSNESVTEERIKLLQKLVPDPKTIVFGQYEGYLSEENIDPGSLVDSYFAFKTEIKNPRFEGIPIYVRGGKQLAQTATEISIVFKKPINRLFSHLDSGKEPNVLIYRMQPNEGIVLKILTKKPGQEVGLEPSYMQFCYRQDLTSHYLPDPYERLLLDTIKGDQTFFSDAKEVEAEWAFIDPLVEARSKPFIYKPGTWGPKEADELIEKDGKTWLEPSMDFCRI